MSVTASIIAPEQAESRVSDFFALLKPRVMSLVVFSGFAGMWVAPGFSHLSPVLAVTAMLALAVGAGAAGAANMWYERDIDALMRRTQGRPLPQGRVAPDEALSFAVVLSVLAVLTMGLALNWTAAGLLAAGNLFYVFVYTVWLKRRTPQNIVIGGAAGAFPPMIGWAAVTGHIALFPVILFAVIFLWTPPHFWALSLFMSDDYKRAGIPMMPAVKGPESTKRQMLFYTLILTPVALAPTLLGYAGVGYGIAALVLNLFFIFTAVQVLRDDTQKSARLMFGYSIFYLFALFLALMAESEMGLTEAHKKKRNKNLAVLALVLGWCALIWLVTMTRLAHGAEIPPGGDFLTTRTAHRALLETRENEWDKHWQSRDSDRVTNENTRNTQRGAHMTRLDNAKTGWDKHWDDGEAKRESNDTERSTQRAAHAQLLEDRPAGWYAEWQKDYNKSTP